MRRAAAVVAVVAVVAVALVAACADQQGAAPPGTSTATTTAVTSRPAGTCWSAPIKPSTGDPAFEDATDAFGLVDPLLGMFGHAAAVGDVNDDGWLDLFVGTFADRPVDRYQVRGADGPAPDRLLLGGPDGFRVDADFPGEMGRTSGAVFADLDGDGDPDLVAARNARSDATEDNPDVLSRPTTVFENEGRGRFRAAAVLVPEQKARAVAPVDVDGDGLLDLFVAADGRDASSALLHNEGDFEFRDITAGAGIPTGLAGFGVAAADLTGDGHADLVIAGSNKVLVADGEGEFEDATPPDFDWKTFGNEDLVTAVAVGDLDRDGRVDVVVGHHFNSTVDDGQKVPIRVFLNHSTDGRLRLDEVTADAAVPDFPTKAAHVEIADFDNDGWPDILATASAGDGAQPSVLRNEGVRDGVPRFAAPAGLGDARYWVTGAVADFDHDGRLDVFVVAIDPGEPSLLLRNTGPSGHWLAVGAPLGSAVAAYPTGGAGDAGALLGHGEVVGSTGYAAGAAPLVHIGLGDATRADVVVTAPDGTTTRLDGVAADQLVRPGDC